MFDIDSLIDAWKYVNNTAKRRAAWRKNGRKYEKSERGKKTLAARQVRTKQEQAAYHREYAETVEGRSKIIYTVTKRRAVLKGLEFSIPLTQISDALYDGFCEKTGIEFDFGPPPKDCRVNPWAPSIDRIDNLRGYAIGNVQMVCNAFNIAKNDFPEHVVYALAQALVNQKG